MTYNIVALPGDGIGPEILNGSLSLLEIIRNKYNFNYQIEHHEFGGASIDTFGEPLTEKTLNACKEQMLFYWVQSVDLNGQILTIDQNKDY